MMQFAYLGSLLTAIGFLVLADWRFQLAFFYDWRRTTKVIATAISFFLIWDILGVTLKIFFPGNSQYDLGILILPKVPIEELFFLFLLTYVTLLLWRGYAQLHRT